MMIPWSFALMLALMLVLMDLGLGFRCIPTLLEDEPVQPTLTPPRG